ncbi:MAG: DUF547 domain-containing protein [Bacteriovorax sp.]|nr:DUF547 domain-containing protein [Bacteriovorax sp.]
MKMLIIVTTFIINSIYVANASSFDHSHSNWTAILKNNVVFKGNSSSVNYSDLKQTPGPLNLYLQSLESVSMSEFSTFNESQKLAFLINTYNAFTIKLIIDHYPVKSIKDIGSVFSSPWKKKFFKLFNEEISLDQIEHNKIRNHFKEARIHFALVCASKGCPALLNEAYIATKLHQQLENSSKLFLRDLSRNQFNKEKLTLELSPIFKWYGEDFKKYYGSIKEFIANLMYDDRSIQELIKNNKTEVKFTDYDWSLNEK